MQTRPHRILPVIVASQFAGTSIWFAGNAVLGDLERDWGLAAGAVGHATSAVQLGFIAGTLVFAFFALSDRWPARAVFLACALLGAAANLGVLAGSGLAALVGWRFATGFFLAGIYPVGMKIAAGWYREDLGKALGWLVGALVLGTAFPHLLKSLGQAWPWQSVLAAVSAVAALGGAAIYLLVPDGPYLTKGARFDPRALASVFRSPAFRASAFGYFGHMWELYAFWAFVPLALAAHGAVTNVSFWSFAVIAAGFAGCVAGGHRSRSSSSPLQGSAACSPLSCSVRRRPCTSGSSSSGASSSWATRRSSPRSTPPARRPIASARR
jgi:MFS family permease